MSHFDYDFPTGAAASCTQMAQAARTSIKEAHGDPSYGIMNLTEGNAAKKYKAALAKFSEDAAALKKQGIYVKTVFECDND